MIKTKKLKQERQKKCLAKASEIAEKEKDSHFVVLQLDEAMANSKTLNEVLKSFKKIAPKLPVMLLSRDVSESKITCSSQVPKEKSSLLKANEWVNEISSTINGKGGGRDLNAMASGTNVDSIDECLKLAENFAKVKLS